MSISIILPKTLLLSKSPTISMLLNPVVGANLPEFPRLIPGQPSSSHLMVILSSWLSSPKLLESSLTLFCFSHATSTPPPANPVCSILKTYLECHHLSPPPRIPWGRPLSSLTWNMAMVFLPHGIPTAALAHPESKVRSYPSSVQTLDCLLISELHPTSVEMTPYQWGLPQMPHII